MPQVVERPTDRLRLRGTGVLAVRVEERHHHRLPSEPAHRDRLAVLVLQREVGGLDALWDDRAFELRGRALRLGVVAALGDEDRSSEREDRDEDEGDQNPRVHPADASAWSLLALLGPKSTTAARLGLDQPAADRVADELHAIA